MTDTNPDEMYAKFRAQMEAGKSVAAFYVGKDDKIEVDFIIAEGQDEEVLKQHVARAAYETYMNI